MAIHIFSTVFIECLGLLLDSGKNILNTIHSHSLTLSTWRGSWMGCAFSVVFLDGQLDQSLSSIHIDSKKLGAGSLLWSISHGCGTHTGPLATTGLTIAKSISSKVLTNAEYSRRNHIVPERTRVFPKEPECPRRNHITYLGAGPPHPIHQYSSGNINTPRVHVSCKA